MTFKEFYFSPMGATIQGGVGTTPNDPTYCKPCKSLGKVRSKYVVSVEFEDVNPCKKEKKIARFD